MRLEKPSIVLKFCGVMVPPCTSVPIAFATLRLWYFGAGRPLSLWFGSEAGLAEAFATPVHLTDLRYYVEAPTGVFSLTDLTLHRAFAARAGMCDHPRVFQLTLYLSVFRHLTSQPPAPQAISPVRLVSSLASITSDRSTPLSDAISSW